MPSIYVGTNKIKNIYVGATKIKKVYAGTQKVYSAEPSKVTSISALSVSRKWHAGASNANYALFAGGYGATIRLASVETYSSTLIRGTASDIDEARTDLSGGSVGEYALFAGGGRGSTTRLDNVTAYNGSNVKITATTLSSARQQMGTANVGVYVLFAFGNLTTSSLSNEVDAYNASLVKVTAPVGTRKYMIVGASNPQYAIFNGGATSSADTQTAEAYNASLVRTSSITGFYNTGGAGTSVGDYAVLATYDGGANYADGRAYAYSSNLTRTTLTDLTDFSNLAAGFLGNKEYALFAGGSGYYGRSSNVEMYDIKLVKTTLTSLNTARAELQSARVGSYLVFAGGSTASGAISSAVDAYDY